MYKIPLLLFLVFLSRFSGAIDWYSTSASGMPGSPLNSPGPTAEGWSMSVEQDSGRELQSVYLDGALQTTTEITRDGNQLVGIQERDSKGQIVSDVRYSYDVDGHPRALFSDSARPFDAIINATSPDRPNYRVTLGNDLDWTITDFDKDLNTDRNTEIIDEKEQKSVSWNRESDGSYSQEIVNSGGKVTFNLFDINGRLVSTSDKINNKLVLVRTYVWDNNNLIRVEERGDGGTSIRDMVWNDGQMIEESLTINGVLVKKIEQLSDKQSVEILYRDGKESVRIYLEDGIRVKEEYQYGGQAEKGTRDVP